MQRVRGNQRTRTYSQAVRSPVLPEAWQPCEEHPGQMSERKRVHVRTPHSLIGIATIVTVVTVLSPVPKDVS